MNVNDREAGVRMRVIVSKQCLIADYKVEHRETKTGTQWWDSGVDDPIRAQSVPGRGVGGHAPNNSSDHTPLATRVNMPPARCGPATPPATLFVTSGEKCNPRSNDDLRITIAFQALQSQYKLCYTSSPQWWGSGFCINLSISSQNPKLETLTT